MSPLDRLSENRDYQFWTLQAIGWTGWVVLFAIRDFYWSQSFDRIPLLIVDALAGLGLTTLLRYVYRSVWDRPVLIRILVILFASYLMAAIWQPVKNYAQYVYYDEFEAFAKYGYMALFGGILGYSYFLMLCWSGLYFGIKFYQLLQEEKAKSIKAESMAHEAQLRMLRYQLNPHFLFNTLNAISTLIIDKNTATANAMVSKLSNFLRYSLDKDPMKKVDVEHEIDTMKLYLEIEQLRFDDRLDVEFDIEDHARKALVPSLLLQPLVENSIKYAVAQSENGGKIEISARVIDGDLQLQVSDNGPGLDTTDGALPEFRGVGLANTRHRLRELYGDRHSCRFSEAKPHGLNIEIRIPFETE
ncbi:MAG: histidine kinase [Pseudomonadales bacterium]